MKSVNYLLILLFVFASFNAGKWLMQFKSQDYHPLDFRTYYLGAQAFQKHHTPYSDSFNNEIWLKMQDSNNNWSYTKNSPHSKVVYAPAFVYVFACFTWMKFDIAKWIQLAINLLSIFFISYLISKINPAWKLKYILLSILAFKGTWFGLSNGQPLFVILLICIYSIYLINVKKRPILSGILLGVVSFKFTLVLPIAIGLLFNKNHKAFFTCAIASAALNASILAFNPNIAFDWQNNIQSLWNYIHQNQYNPLNIICTGISPALKIAFDIQNNLLKFSLLLISLTLYALVYFSKSSYHKKLFILVLIGFVFGQHLLYDLLFLICMYLIAYSQPIRMNFSKTLLVFLILLPMGKLSDVLKMDFIHLALPIGLLIFLIQTFYEEVLSKYKTIKKES